MIELLGAKTARDEVRRLTREFTRKVEKAERMALNRTVTWAKTQLKKEVRSKYTVKAKAVADSLKSKNASGGVAGIWIKGEPIPMNRFTFTPRKPSRRIKGRKGKPVRVTIKKGETKTLGDNVFVANIGANRVVRRLGPKRLPIRQLYGPSVAGMIDKPETIADLKFKAYEKYGAELARILNVLGDKL